MEKLGEVYLDFNQNDVNIDDLNLNALWVDLDKGLQSDNIGLTCELIVKITDLFNKYPLPVFVNSGFLRLAKIFQNGNNYLKLQVIRVIEKSQKHLQKILSVEEILKLIFYNIHSNDSICRALTLRALADISMIISDRHTVQHSIRLALESHDETEAKAAIYAANKFCSVSKSFAASLFDRISEMIEDIQSPLDRKMQLIPLLIHMHHDTVLSAKAKNLCKAIFYSFPRTNISKIVLDTLTQIACKSLTNINDTITFFIKLLHEEPREKLHLTLLRNLNFLAKKVSHLWTIENINNFLVYAKDQSENILLMFKASDTICTLAKNSNAHFYFVFNSLPSFLIENSKQEEIPMQIETKHEFDNKNLIFLIETMIFHENKNVALNFCSFTTTLLVSQSKTMRKLKANNCDEPNKHLLDPKYLFELTKNALFALILDTNKNLNDQMETNLSESIKFLQKCLKCAIDLVQVNNESYFDQFYVLVSSLLDNRGKFTAHHYCETLLNLCRFENLYKKKNKSENYFNKQEFISNIFTQLCDKYEQNHEIDCDLQLKIINLLFELQIRKENCSKNLSSDNDIERDQSQFVQNSIKKFLIINEKNWWSIFKLARMCVRYAHYELANHLYERMSKEMTNDITSIDLSYKSWLEFMSIICKSECLITQSNVKNLNELIGNLNSALSNYIRAQALYKSSCTKCFSPSNVSVQVFENSSTCFQIRYCELRTEQIKIYIHLILSTMTYQTIPAPKFQFKSSENFGKFGRIAQQMKYSLVEMQKLSQKYKELISESFDADEHTLNILNICKKQNECLMYCINLLSVSKSEQVLSEEFKLNFLENNSKKFESFENMNENELPEGPAELKLIESFYFNLYEKLKFFCKQEKDANFKFNQIKQFQEILIDFIGFSIPLPRLFFNSLQKTNIKLIINPKKNNNTIRNDQNLVVKIDGIINQSCKTKKPIRTIKKVQICLTIELDSKFVSTKYTDIKTSLEQPKNDYFSSHMLLNFPYCGNYTIQVDLYIVDNFDLVWHYLAEKNQIFVKCEEDPTRQKLAEKFAAIAAAAATANSSNNANGSNSTYQQQQQLQNIQQQQRLTPIASELIDNAEIQQKMEN